MVHDDSQTKAPSIDPSTTNNLCEKPHQTPTRRTFAEGVADLTEYIVKERRVGEGAFSDVWRQAYGWLTISSRQEQVAIKCPRTISYVHVLDKERIKRNVAKEIFTSSKLCHPNVIKLLGYARLDDYECDTLVMELCPRGTLEQLLRTPGISRMEQSAMILQLAAGINYMHSNDVVHADLKPNNVLIGPQGQIKISDFGLSRIINNGAPTSNRAHYGAEAYMAPELCQDQPAVKTFYSDVWAFGVVTYQLLEYTVMEPYSYLYPDGANPFYTSHKRIEAKVAGRLPYEDGGQSNELSQHFMSTIISCWSFEANVRPRMSALLALIYEKFLNQDLSALPWDWLFLPSVEACARASVIGGANSDDLLQLSASKYAQGAYTESRLLRAKAAVDKLFRGDLLGCANIQKELAASCVGQYDREATLRHYESAIRKYEMLGPAHANAAEACRNLKRDAAEGRQSASWCNISSRSAEARRVAEAGEHALDENDFAAATRHFEELFDIARRDGRRDIMAQACVRLAWACELQSQLKLVRAKEHYLKALEYYEGAESASPSQRIIEDDLKRLAGVCNSIIPIAHSHP